MACSALRRRRRFMHLVLGSIFLSSLCLAEDQKPNPHMNAYLTPKLEQILKNSLRVIGENDEEGVLFVSMPQGRSFVDGTQIIFFRKRHSRLEVISIGTVDGEGVDPKTKKMGIKVVVDRDTIVKYPVLGDHAAPMSDPDALGSGERLDEFDYLMPIEEKPRVPNEQPGYIEYGMGIMTGYMNTTTTTVANDSKTPTRYRFPVSHFVYYSEYAPVGIEYDAHGGLFPTSTYYQTLVATRESVSTTTFNYRFMPLLEKRLEFVGRLAMLSNQFTTVNTDEHLLSTSVTGTGFGVKANYNWASPVWKQAGGEPFFKLQNVFAELNVYPSLTAADDGVSRGTSASGSAFQYRVGATMLFWFDFIPVVKRWVIQGSYGATSYNLTFSGATTPEDVPSPVTIQEGTIASERETDYRFFVGIRFEDPIKLLFDNEEDDKRKDKKR